MIGDADEDLRRKVTFIDKEGESHTFEVADGDNLLDIAQANDLEMEGSYNSERRATSGSPDWKLPTHHIFYS